MKQVLLLGAAFLTIAAGPTQAQLHAPSSSESLQAVTPIAFDAGSQKRQLFGSILLEAITESRLALALDLEGAGQAGDGWTDLVVLAETSETVEQLLPYRGFGVISVEARRIEILLPEQASTLALSLDMQDDELVDHSTLVHVSSLASWVPRADQSLTLEEALLWERHRVEGSLRSLSSGQGLEEKHQDTGSGGGTGSCAASASVTCQDGTSASASCGSDKCASCSCPNATCGCVG